VGVDEGVELARRPVAGLPQPGLETLEVTGDELTLHREQDLALVLVVVVDQPLRQAGGAGDLADRRGLVAVAGHDLDQRGRDLRAPLLGVRCPWHDRPAKLIGQPTNL
jgi:hypothetical protein